MQLSIEPLLKLVRLLSSWIEIDVLQMPFADNLFGWEPWGIEFDTVPGGVTAAVLQHMQHEQLNLIAFS